MDSEIRQEFKKGKRSVVYQFDVDGTIFKYIEGRDRIELEEQVSGYTTGFSVDNIDEAIEALQELKVIYIATKYNK